MSRPRIRTLKPECWQDERVGALSRDARLLWVGLITMADDEGRLRALPSMILGHAFPWDEIPPRKLSEWIEEIEGQQLIIRYEDAGKPYVAFRNWRRHQQINKSRPSELPPPPDPVVVRENSRTSAVPAPVALPDVVRHPRGRGSDRERNGNGTDPTPRARGPIASTIAEVETVLRQCQRLHVDRIGLENAVGSWPGRDPVQAARTVVTWATDPAFRTTNAAKLLGDALSKQPPPATTLDGGDPDFAKYDRAAGLA